jgi:hypothetical protein
VEVVWVDVSCDGREGGDEFSDFGVCSGSWEFRQGSAGGCPSSRGHAGGLPKFSASGENRWDIPCAKWGSVSRLELEVEA